MNKCIADVIRMTRFQSYINTAEWLLGRDVPVHGVGVQSHLDGYELNFPVMLVRTYV